MALRKFIYIDPIEGFHSEQAATDELSLGKVTAVGVGGVAFDASTNTIVNVGDPSSATDAANKRYVDNAVNGLDWKQSVRAATSGNITLSGAQTIDGVSVIAGDRVLVKAQTTGSQNGIYIAAAGAWSRSADADNSPTGEVTAGLATFVEEGTLYADTGWVLVTDNPITLGTTALTFSQFTPTSIASMASALENLITASGAIAKGDAVYWSASNAVSTGDNTVDAKSRIMGIAAAAIPDTTAGLVVSAGTVTGVLTGATPGAPYYMDTTGQPTATLPGSSKRIIQLGFAKNATDLWVEIKDFGKKA